MGPSKGDYGAAMWNEPVENRRTELHPTPTLLAPMTPTLSLPLSGGREERAARAARRLMAGACRSLHLAFRNFEAAPTRPPSLRCAALRRPPSPSGRDGASGEGAM